MRRRLLSASGLYVALYAALGQLDAATVRSGAQDPVTLACARRVLWLRALLRGEPLRFQARRREGVGRGRSIERARAMSE